MKNAALFAEGTSKPFNNVNVTTESLATNEQVLPMSKQKIWSVGPVTFN